MRVLALPRSIRVVFGGLLLLAPLTWTLAARVAAAEKGAGEEPAESAIRATADVFVKAFNRGDAAALAALWTENGTLANDGGQVLKGRKAIEDEYAALFKAHPGLRMEVAVQSIEIATPTVAIEDGIARAVDKGGAASAASRYTAIHVLQDGKWLMASVRESRIELPSNDSRLQQLTWLVGKWKAKSDDTTVRTEVRWSANKSFLHRDYAVRKGGIATSSGTQIIGWDPQARRVRSWSFDSSGGYGTGHWTATPDGWQIDSTGVMTDGTPTSSRDFVIRVAGENDVFGWRSVDRKVGPTVLPDTGEVVLERETAASNSSKQGLKK
jgi:uncharacterized protein (TIGR02246 family)